jgi:hypothetical protein
MGIGCEMHSIQGGMSMNAGTKGRRLLTAKKGFGLHLAGLLTLGLAITAQATLVDRGNGMIYDTDQDLTYMFHVNLGNESGHNPDLSSNTHGCPGTSPYCMQSTRADGVGILNLQSGFYGAGTEYASFIYNAWVFNTQYGSQGTLIQDVALPTWAVRSGDVADTSIPEPDSLVLMIVGLAGLVALRRRRR